MIGAECLLRTLLAHGIDTCFMNPGTSEMQFVSALDKAPEMRGVLCLFEGVCSGAADGYARMRGRPAATLLHLGPGLGNALANLHNARKAFSPVVNIVGEHTTQHLEHDAPLSADIEAFACPVSGWVRTLESAAAMGSATAEAIRAACGPPGQVATLIIPADYSWSDAGQPAPPLPPAPVSPVPAESVEAIARILESGEPAGLLIGGNAVRGRGLRAAGRLATATGTRVHISRDAARLARGTGMFAPHRLAYFPEHAAPMLAGLRHLILVESKPPVSFFGYPTSPSFLAPPDCRLHLLAGIGADGTSALEALVERCGAGKAAIPVPGPASKGALPAGPLTLDAIGAAIAALLPEGTIVSDEMVSSGEIVGRHLLTAAPHDHLPVTGGSIGQGLPVGLGAAMACPDRKVLALEADGSGMYTLQSLWTIARENLDIVTVIFANRRYRILDVEMKRTGAGAVGPKANEMMDIGRPELDWVKLAEAQGVQAVRVRTAAEFAGRFEAAMGRRGPLLIEALID